MSLPSGKKLLLFGFIVVMLLVIPLTVYIVQQQQKTRSSAQKSTTLGFNPASVSNVYVGQNFNLDVMMNPGVNQVSFVKMVINYDATKLATASAGPAACPIKPNDALCPNTIAFPSILQGPIYGPGTISMTLSIGGSPQNIVQATTKIASLYFQAIAPTDAAPTQVTIDSQNSQVLSIASTDQFSENVLSSVSPANVTILASSSATPTPTPAPTATPTPTPTPTPAPTATPTSQAPVCQSLSLSGPASGAAPYSLTLTATGTSSASTISKVTFNFGDSSIQDVTNGGGIGSSSVSVQTSHTYNSGGSFVASATFTDALGNVSDTTNCTETITVSATPSATVIAQATPSPKPPLLPTGPSDKIVAAGILGTIITIVGALVFFAL